MKKVLMVGGITVLLWSQEGTVTNSAEQLQAQLKAANERIAQLELLLKQQQGLAQFFQAGQALCELKQPAPAKTDAK